MKSRTVSISTQINAGFAVLKREPNVTKTRKRDESLEGKRRRAALSFLVLWPLRLRNKAVSSLHASMAHSSEVKLYAPMAAAARSGASTWLDETHSMPVHYMDASYV